MVGAVLVVALWTGIRWALVEYCTVIEATVLTCRSKLYLAIGWVPPASSADEVALGAELDFYLTRLGPVAERELQWPTDG